MPPATGTVNVCTLQELETYSYPSISIRCILIHVLIIFAFSLFNPLKIYIFLIFEKVLMQRLKVLHRIFKMA